jgi:thiamine-phosphate pyrophosphorylase
MLALEAQSAARRKLMRSVNRVKQHFPPDLPALWFLTDPQRAANPLHIAAGLPRGTAIVLRHFGRDDQKALAPALARIARQRGLVFLIAADPQLAARVKADGVHWPFAQRAEARLWRGRFRIMSVSAHSARELRAVDTRVFVAALVSTVFASQSASASPPMGTLGLRRLLKLSRVKLIGLGGVNAANASAIAPFSGLAAVDGLVELF